MVFGTCCILVRDDLKGLEAKSVKIEGTQRGLIVNFEVTQTFMHTEKEPKEASYVFPNDLKICIYDTTFVVGEEIIKPKLQSKEEAKKTYKEAVEAGHTAVHGTNIGYGLTQFKLGNLPPETECKVILKIAFPAQLTKEKSFFVKFPLDVYTPSGSKGCLDVSSSKFSFQIQAEKEKVAKITSNVKNGNFDEASKVFSINDKVQYNDNQKSIILTFESQETIQSSALLTPANTPNYDGCAITISPNLPSTETLNSEFVFVVDCSGSMGGDSIKKASECLEFFIRSLPPNSLFNVVRFGSSFEKLFENSVEYDDNSAEKAINLAKGLKSNLGGTDIYRPLEDIFKEKPKKGQRQIFIMTDGEVNDVAQVLELIGSHSNENRCFTIGIGRGCDAGLVEGMASASGGKSDFVQEGDSISEKVIPQLQSSLHPSLTSIEIHIEGEGNDAFQVSPYPLPPVNANGANVIYLREKKKDNSFEGGILISGTYGKESVDIPVEETEKLVNCEEDKFGCSGGKNIGNAILPLFAFCILQNLDRRRNISDEDKQKAIELSISSGVLCKYTGYVGMTAKPTRRAYYDAAPMRCCCKCCRMAAPQACCRMAAPNACNRMSAPKMACKEMACKEMACKEMACKEMACEEMACKEMACEEMACKEMACEEMACKEMACKEMAQMNQKACCYKIDAIGCAPQRDTRRLETKINKTRHSCNERPKEHKEDQNLPKSYDLLTITRYQKISGYWENLKAINSMLGLNIDHIDGVDLSDDHLKDQCVATILALAAIHVKSQSEKSSWLMIEQKAINWLKNTLPGVDVEQIIQKTEQLIH